MSSNSLLLLSRGGVSLNLVFLCAHLQPLEHGRSHAMYLLTLAFKTQTPSTPLVICPVINQLLYEKSGSPETALL